MGTAALMALSAASPVAAQQAGATGQPVRNAAATTARAEDPKLMFEREVFTYSADNRRDPFRPLGQGMGPMFEDLMLRMIIYSDVPNGSIAVLADGARKVYRVRRGESVGNATVLEISPSRVVFVVEDYGNRRQEILDLKPKKDTEGA